MLRSTQGHLIPTLEHVLTFLLRVCVMVIVRLPGRGPVEILGSRCRDSELEDHVLEVADPDPGLLGAAIFAILQDGVQRCCLDAVAS